MALPGWEWTRRQLGSVESETGGIDAKMRHPVMAGAGFAFQTVLIAAWLVALIPLLLWQLAGRANRRA